MRFVKDGKSFDTIDEARMHYCEDIACGDCAVHCKTTCKENPRKAAELMGFEVIEDDPMLSCVTKDIDGMTLAHAKEYCRMMNKETHGDCTVECILRDAKVCQLIPHAWRLRLSALTPDETAICHTLEAKWVSMDNAKYPSLVVLWKSEPHITDERTYTGGGHIASVDAGLFPSVKPGDCICVDTVR